MNTQADSTTLALEPKEKTINLQYLIYYVIKRWRIILWFILVFAVVRFIMIAAPVAYKLINGTYENSYQSNYNESVTAYWEKIDALESEIQSIKDKQSYYDEFLLVKIDPNQVVQVQLVYGVDVENPAMQDNVLYETVYPAWLSVEYIEYLSDQIQEKTQELEKLNAQGPPETISKALVKNSVIAAALGLIVAILMLTIYYIMSDKILDVEKLVPQSSIALLGTVPTNSPKKKISNKTVAVLCGKKRQVYDYDNIIALTAKSICAMTLNKGIMEGDIALAGSIGTEELAKLEKAFNQSAQNTQMNFTVAGNPMRDLSSIEIINAAKMVVIVEKQDVSLNADVVQEIERIISWGKPVLGIVLLDTDTL